MNDWPADFKPDGHPVVTIYPAMIIGPDDWNESEQTKPTKLWLTKPYPRSKGFTISCVDVRDIAEVMAASMRRGRGARRYVMFGQPYDLRGAHRDPRFGAGRGT